MRAWKVMVWITAVSILLVGCSGRPKIEYRISGSASDVEIFYRDYRGDMVQERVEIPWRTSFRGSDPFQFELNAYGDGRSGTVGCTVWVNGQEVGSVAGKTYAECFGSYEQGVSSFKGRFDE